jgi:hypothetical protein
MRSRRNESLAARLVPKNLIEQRNAVAKRQDASNRMMIDEYSHDDASPLPAILHNVSLDLDWIAPVRGTVAIRAA